MYGVGNTRINDNDKAYVRLWLDDENTQQWFNKVKCQQEVEKLQEDLPIWI